MSLFYKQNAAARFFVDQTNGKVYEVVGGSAALLCMRAVIFAILCMFT